MFGGVGIYAGELFFALIADDTVYFKVDQSNRPEFEARGMGPFRPYGEGGEVMLGGARDGDGIRIEIRNPLPPQPGVAGNGHGLRSVRQRVAFRYGPRAVVEAGPHGDRYRVLLRLPGVS